MNANSTTFIPSSVKKIFEYNIRPSGFIFLQRTHSSKNYIKKWEDEFKGKLYFSWKNKFLQGV